MQGKLRWEEGAAEKEIILATVIQQLSSLLYPFYVLPYFANNQSVSNHKLEKMRDFLHILLFGVNSCRCTRVAGATPKSSDTLRSNSPRMTRMRAK